MHATQLVRARAGDEEAFRELTGPYRRELELHCYRILGSLQDAEDTLQETLLAAWRGLDEFEGRASLRTWLYRIGPYLDDRHAPIARPCGFLVLTLDGEQISAIAFFSDTSVFAHFGLPRTLP